MKVLNTAIIGCGAISGTHAEAVAGLKSSRLYAVCDVDHRKAGDAAHRYDCALFTDYGELLKDKKIDVVHICTPHYLHARMAIEAMKSGKHVLTEKPMSITAAEALKMNEISRETGMTLGVCFQNRYNATSLRIGEVLKSGKAGRILGAKAMVTWKREAEYYMGSSWRGKWETEGGGVLINQAIHTLDLMQWFMGEVNSVRAHTDTRLLEGIIEVEDTADATITFKSGSSLLFYATNNYAANSPVEIEILCEKAVIRLSDRLVIRYSDGTSEETEEIDRATGEKAYWGSSHKSLIRDFHQCIQEGKPFGLDGRQGITAIRIIDAINRSSRAGTVTIPLP
jgi:predicted dehydrogenase